jgi:hypothetical protein
LIFIFHTLFTSLRSYLSGSVEEESDFGFEDIIPAVSRAAKNGRKKKNEIEMEKLKKKTTVKTMRFTALDLNQVRAVFRTEQGLSGKIFENLSNT